MTDMTDVSLANLEDHEAHELAAKIQQIIDLSNIMASNGDSQAHNLYCLARDCKDLLMFDALSRQAIKQLTYDHKIMVNGIEIPQTAIAFIRAGQTINAIKEVRSVSFCGLKEAKDAVEKWASDNGCYT